MKGQSDVLVVNVNVNVGDFYTLSLLDITCTRMDLKLDYWVWIEHGEVLPPENQFNVGYVGSSLTRAHVGNEEGDNVTWEDNRSRY